MEIRDLDFANDASFMLSIMVDHFSEGVISQNDRRYNSVAKGFHQCSCRLQICDSGVSEIWKLLHVTWILSLGSCRFIIKLLEDVVFFVVDQVNNEQPVLEVVMSKPNRERQKLMREQNILKQVSSSFQKTSCCFFLS